jgi:hypothetical protein
VLVLLQGSAPLSQLILGRLLAQEALVFASQQVARRALIVQRDPEDVRL